MSCLSCRRGVAGTRGLCWQCRSNPIVHELFPPRPRSVRGVGHGKRRRPCTPTKTIPGTAAKIRVLSARAAAGQELFHVDDATLAPVPFVLDAI